MDNLRDGIHHALASERRNARDNIVKNCTQSVDISRGSNFCGFPHGLFGCHVTGGAHDRPIAGLNGIAFQSFSQTKVGNLGNK